MCPYLGKGSPHSFSHPRISHPRHPPGHQHGVRPLSSGIWPPARPPVIGWSHSCPHRTRARTLSPQAKWIYRRQAGRRAGGGVQVPRPREQRPQSRFATARGHVGVPKTHKCLAPPDGGSLGARGPCSLSHCPQHPGPTPETQEQLGKWGLEAQDHQPARASPELEEQQWRRWFLLGPGWTS